MDLSKFISLISSSCLFFCRLDGLGDPFEGTTTKVNRDLWRRLKEDRHADPSLSSFAHLPDAMIDHIIASQPQISKTIKKMFHVNCWHMGEHESAAMWKVYSQSSDAVAVKSTYKKLRDALPRDIHIGEINYIDYNVDAFDEGNVFNYVLRKRKSFEYERELRAVKMDSSVFDASAKPDADTSKGMVSDGSMIRIRTTDVIDAVYISPAATKWFADIVRDLCRRYGLVVPVNHSSLLDTPFD